VAKTKKEYSIAVTVHKVPLDDKERAIDLIAKLVLKNYAEELKHSNAFALESVRPHIE
jgi:hypothetical protein